MIEVPSYLNINPLFQSGRRDLNPGPLQPHCSALPNCATPRTMEIIPESASFSKSRSQVFLSTRDSRSCFPGESVVQFLYTGKGVLWPSR